MAGWLFAARYCSAVVNRCKSTRNQGDINWANLHCAITNPTILRKYVLNIGRNIRMSHAHTTVKCIIATKVSVCYLECSENTRVECVYCYQNQIFHLRFVYFSCNRKIVTKTLVVPKIHTFRHYLAWIITISRMRRKLTIIPFNIQLLDIGFSYH